MKRKSQQQDLRERISDVASLHGPEALGPLKAELGKQADLPPIASHAEAGAQGRRGKKATDATEAKDDVSFSGFGNPAYYALRRLQRDRPDLAERVIACTMSVNAAAIEAGYRIAKVAVPFDGDKAADVLIRKFSAAELRKLNRRLTDHLGRKAGAGGKG